VRSTPPRAPAGLPGIRPVVAGTACCVISALGYTAANICMRRLAEMQVDPIWATSNKESVTVLVLGPWLAWQAIRGRIAMPSPRALAALVVVGLAVQLAANVGVQWAYGIVGLAIVIPTVFGVSLTATAVLGQSLLGERVSGRSVLALGLLVMSIALLSLGAGTAHRSVVASSGAFSSSVWATAGVAAACLAGAVYAVLNVTIRRAVNGSAPPTIIALIVTGMGALSLVPLSLYRLGLAGLLHTSGEALVLNLAAGVLNLVAFLAIIRGLQLTTLVHANVLNASQVAMAAVAGMLLFHEPPSPWIILGIALTVAGIVLIDRPGDADAAADERL